MLQTPSMNCADEKYRPFQIVSVSVDGREEPKVYFWCQYMPFLDRTLQGLTRLTQTT